MTTESDLEDMSKAGNEILPDGIIEQRIDPLARLIHPHSWDFMESMDPMLHNPLSHVVQFYSAKKLGSIDLARKLVAAGWCPGPIGEKPILDKYFKT